MARFKLGEENKYGGQGGSGFFSLRNDRDTAKVRFLIDGPDDVEGFAVHEVEVNGKKRYVNCIREVGDPKDVCPFCKEGHFTQVKFFLPLYNIDEDKVQIWERGKTFGPKIAGLLSRYAKDEPLCSHVFEIERHGEPKSTSTTYEIYNDKTDDTTLDDLPERPKILGDFLLCKDAEELMYYLDHGEFPSDDEEPVVRRRSSSRDEEEPVRRTPSNRRREEY